MKFLIIFLAIMAIISLIFWLVDAPGSGMGYVTIGLAVGAVLLLIINKSRTGSWFSDNAMGR